MSLMMTLTTKCPDCGERTEKRDLIFTEDGLDGDTVMTCEKCKRQIAVHWRLSLRTKAFRIDKQSLDQQFGIELVDADTYEKEEGDVSDPRS